MDNEEHLPLIAFTTLTPLAVGGLIGLLWEGAGGFAPIAILGVGVLAMVASIFHLGHPARMLRSLLGVASSWLSREVALFGFFLACLAVYALGLQVGSLRSFASLLG